MSVDFKRHTWIEREEKREAEKVNPNNIRNAGETFK